jgi:hypothetical protein
MLQQIYGRHPDYFNRRRKDGRLKKGVHYIVDNDGGILYNLDAMEAYMTGGAPSDHEEVDDILNRVIPA